MARMIVDRLAYQTGLALLETAFEEDRGAFGKAPSELARMPLMQAGLAGHSDVVRVQTGLAVPVIGLGASARSYYPAVGVLMGSEMILPEHAGVANAIGAVVGRVTMRRAGTVTSPSEGLFRVHLESGLRDFTEEAPALALLEQVLRDGAEEQAKAAGAEDIQISVERDIRRARAEAREVFVEATITVEAAGRPRVALG